MCLLRVQRNVCSVLVVYAAGKRARTLPDQKPNAYPRQVESIQPRLDVQPDRARLLALLPLQNTLGDGGHSRVVPALNSIERLREERVIMLHLGRECHVPRVGVVPAPASENDGAELYAHAPSLHRHPQLQLVKAVPVCAVDVCERGARKRGIGGRLGQRDVF